MKLRWGREAKDSRELLSGLTGIMLGRKVAKLSQHLELLSSSWMILVTLDTAVGALAIANHVDNHFPSGVSSFEIPYRFSGLI